jgi:DNA-binding transcriptional MocR family regulator
MSLSTRSARASAPSLPYWPLFAEALSNLHDPDTNPDGIVAMVVAENALSAGLFADKLRSLCPVSRPGVLGYDDMRGRHSLRKAFAAVAERHILRGCGAAVAPRELTVGGGCGALINLLSFLLLDRGECVLLPTPTYAVRAL